MTSEDNIQERGSDPEEIKRIEELVAQMFAKEKAKETVTTPSPPPTEPNKPNYEQLYKEKVAKEEEKKRSDLMKQLSPKDRELYENVSIGEIERYLKTKRVGVEAEPTTTATKKTRGWSDKHNKNCWFDEHGNEIL